MSKIGAVLLAVAAVSPVFAQPVTSMSTLCQATGVSLGFDNIVDRRLIGCGEGFPDNLLWNLDRSDSISGALDKTVKRRLTGRGSVVYVLDNGVLQTHDEFVRATGTNVIAGIDIASTAPANCPVLAPCARTLFEWAVYGHGTAVASVVAGKQVGVAPGASIVAVRIESNSDASWASALRAVITHAYAPGTPSFKTGIVTMSASPGDGNYPLSETLMRRMVSGVDANGNPDSNGKRFLFTVMAGNYGAANSFTGLNGQCRADATPALFQSVLGPAVEGIITVGGLTPENTEWEGACRGGAVEVLAPAHQILVASNSGNDRYRFEPSYFVSGTSYSTPYVAGIAARMLEENPYLTPPELEARIKASPSRVGAYAVPVLVDESLPVPPKRRSARR